MRKATSTASRKAKGRRASQEVKESLLRMAPSLKEDDIIVKPSGVPGEDLYLSPAAQLAFPYAFEIKNQEALNFWDAIAQSEHHGEMTRRTPLLVFKRNNTKLRVCLDFEKFLELTTSALP